jgi:hypothetical protein
VKSHDAAWVADGYRLPHPPGPQEISELILKHFNTREMLLCCLGSTLCFIFFIKDILLLYNFDVILVPATEHGYFVAS